ncbi:MAG: hypothetical protein ABI863_05565 [Ginsengibacter sp.]
MKSQSPVPSSCRQFANVHMGLLTPSSRIPGDTTVLKMSSLIFSGNYYVCIARTPDSDRNRNINIGKNSRTSGPLLPIGGILLMQRFYPSSCHYEKRA